MKTRTVRRSPVPPMLALGLVLALALANGSTGRAVAQSPDVAMTYIEGQVVTTIDPAKHTDESSHHAVINMYDPLLYPKVNEGSMEPGPHVAASWRISDGSRTYTFQLRKGIKFHDGRELTADDVVFSYQRMVALKKGFSWLWQGVLTTEQVRATASHTVVFQLSQPYAPFLATLTQLFIVNKEQVLANKKPGAHGASGRRGILRRRVPDVGLRLHGHPRGRHLRSRHLRALDRDRRFRQQQSRAHHTSIGL